MCRGSAGPPRGAAPGWRPRAHFGGPSAGFTPHLCALQGIPRPGRGFYWGARSLPSPGMGTGPPAPVSPRCPLPGVLGGPDAAPAAPGGAAAGGGAAGGLIHSCSFPNLAGICSVMQNEVLASALPGEEPLPPRPPGPSACSNERNTRKKAGIGQKAPATPAGSARSHRGSLCGGWDEGSPARSRWVTGPRVAFHMCVYAQGPRVSLRRQRLLLRVCV